jgi:HPt (histidine-containing phosphotransfer) domain-containing protein
MQALPDQAKYTAPSADIRPQLARIRIGFLVRLEDRCAEIDRLVNTIDGSGLQPHLIDGLAEHAHKIAGVAATLGFGRLGSLAGQADMAIAALQSQNDWIAARALVETLLDEIEDVLEAQAPDQDRYASSA